MANDRIYLYCRKCHDFAMLYKFYPGGPYPVNGEYLMEFIFKHIDECHEKAYGMHLDGDECFYLEAESRSYRQKQAWERYNKRMRASVEPTRPAPGQPADEERDAEGDASGDGSGTGT